MLTGSMLTLLRCLMSAVQLSLSTYVHAFATGMHIRVQMAVIASPCHSRPSNRLTHARIIMRSRPSDADIQQLSQSMQTCAGVGGPLNGGTSQLTRAYGLAAENIVEAKIVLADGSLVTHSCSTHDSIFQGSSLQSNSSPGLRLAKIRTTTFDLAWQQTYRTQKVTLIALTEAGISCLWCTLFQLLEL